LPRRHEQISDANISAFQVDRIAIYIASQVNVQYWLAALRPHFKALILAFVGVISPGVHEPPTTAGKKTSTNKPVHSPALSDRSPKYPKTASRMIADSK
jgi:hypothetical protein